MKFIATSIVVLMPCLAAAQDAGSVNKLISDALLPLPEPLRAAATVVLDREPGKREVLRKGTNQMVCRANPPGAPFFIVRCYHKDLDPLLTRIDELSASRTPEHQLHEAISAEVKSGKLMGDPWRHRIYAGRGGSARRPAHHGRVHARRHVGVDGAFIAVQQLQTLAHVRGDTRCAHHDSR